MILSKFFHSICNTRLPPTHDSGLTRVVRHPKQTFYRVSSLVPRSTSFTLGLKKLAKARKAVFVWGSLPGSREARRIQVSVASTSPRAALETSSLIMLHCLGDLVGKFPFYQNLFYIKKKVFVGLILCFKTC